MTTIAAALAGIKILVIEDEPIISMFIEDSLSDMGCKSMTFATNLAEAKKIGGGRF